MRFVRWLGRGRSDEEASEDEVPRVKIRGLSGEALPRRWRGYVLLEFLGSGWLGETFLAQLADPTPASDPGRLFLFRRGMARIDAHVALALDEERVRTRLDHPGICRLISLELPDRVLEMVTEYAPGLSVTQLAAAMRRGQGAHAVESRVPWRAGVAVAAQVCEVLEYLHTGSGLEVVASRGGALSADHWFVDHAGCVRLADAGLGHGPKALPWLPQGHCILGGPRMIFSPEAVRGLPLGPASDVFCLGWMLWELVTGQRLFVGETEFDTLEKIIAAQVLLPSRVAPDVPATLDDVIAGALCRRPEERWPIERVAASLLDLVPRAEAMSALATTMQIAFSRETAQTGRRRVSYDCTL